MGASTGNESKAQKAETGVVFTIDLGRNVQINKISGYERNIFRVVQRIEQPQSKVDDQMSAINVNVDGPIKGDATLAKNKVKPALDGSVPLKPAGLYGEGDSLILRKG